MSDWRDWVGKVCETDALQWLRQMRAAQARLCFLDPPYNVGMRYDAYEDNLPECDYRDWVSQMLHLAIEAAQAVAVTPGNGNQYLWASIRQPDWSLCWFKAFTQRKSAIGPMRWEPLLWYGRAPKFHPQGDVIKVQIYSRHDPRDSTHPTPKPRQLLVRIIERGSDHGDLVIDPFIGSGTTAIVAELLQRRWAGCDLSHAYCEMARGRIQRERDKLKLA